MDYDGDSMPFSPSDLPWWGWLLCSLGAWAVCWVTLFVLPVLSEEGWLARCLCVLVRIVSGLAGLVTGAMAIVLFVKWVWNG
jgi:hypothetical protein